MYGFEGCGGWGGVNMMLPFGWFGIVFILLGVYMLYRMSHNKPTMSAIGILDAKYANGEIDEATYLKKKRQLSGKDLV